MSSQLKQEKVERNPDRLLCLEEGKLCCALEKCNSLLSNMELIRTNSCQPDVNWVTSFNCSVELGTKTLC